jgi:hypothetical protein
MTTSAIAKALVVDSNTLRADQIRNALSRARVEVIVRREAVENSGAGCGIDNLWGAARGLPQIDVLFIHLGPMAAERDCLMYGNECAMEFVLHHIRSLRRRCIVAYSGGDSKEPCEFTKVRDPLWHRFFERVNGGSALQIVPFINVWRRAPLDPPPLDQLTRRCKELETFKRLASDYRQAYDASGAPIGSEELSQRERPARWRELFVAESEEDGLLKRLEWAGDNAGLRAATALKTWLADHQDLEEDPLPRFDDELRNAILSMRVWAPPGGGISP